MSRRLASTIASIAIASPALAGPPPTTPIAHLVVIFQENVSFDHYFATYPHASPNKDGTRYFSSPKSDTPKSDTLESAGLLANNPNGTNPFRIDRSVPVTCDQDHGYGAEQYAFHGGRMDRFRTLSCRDPNLGEDSAMGYYDGNTVTALWNYAQHYAMSDRFFGTTFGPSTPGLLNLVAGNTYAGTIVNGGRAADNIAGASDTGAVIGDPDPANDKCSDPKRTQILMSGINVGDLLDEAGVTWGAFMGGFDDCARSHVNASGRRAVRDYIPHHAFFQYWKSTQNADHVPPESDASVGRSDRARHQYDLGRFFRALSQHRLPAVSFLKASAYQDGHAGYSDPLSEQTFIVGIVNTIMQSPEWRDTAIVIAYDDSDGWYDHVMGPIVFESNVPEDRLEGPGICATPRAGDAAGGRQNGRCGYGPRLPLFLISPWAKQNFVDHTVTDQSSILRFIEDNWRLRRIGNGSADAIAGKLDGMFDFGRARRTDSLILDPATGRPTHPD